MGSVTEQTMGKDLAQTMVERIAGTTSHAEALRKLRSAFPESPLKVRVAALAMQRERSASHPAIDLPR
jgi:hypothetical protein